MLAEKLRLLHNYHCLYSLLLLLQEKACAFGEAAPRYFIPTYTNTHYHYSLLLLRLTTTAHYYHSWARQVLLEKLRQTEAVLRRVTQERDRLIAVSNVMRADLKRAQSQAVTAV